ncbi:MAG: DMT family transporter [Ketobacteraceae bacterium]|nr:DMT family transporter [Ketobacteraceae bacterium]
MKSRLGVLALFLGSIGWGLTWIPLKFITERGLHSAHLVLFAFGAGALVLIPWLFRQYDNWKAHGSLMLAIGLAGGIANASFQTAIAHGEVVRVMILFYMLPVWSVIGGRIFLNEPIDTTRRLTVALCLIGGSLILDVFNTSWNGITWIDFLALLSGMGLAATNILFRYTPHITLLSKVGFVFVGCFLLMGVSLSFLPVSNPLPGVAVIGLAVLYGAIGLTVITVATQWGVTYVGAGRASIIIVTELFVAVVSATIILAAPLGPAEIFGGLLVTGAALIEGFRAEEINPETA